MATRIIHLSDVKPLIESIQHGKFFSMFFERVAPKCTHCQKSNKKWKGLTNCPVCGSPLSFERETIAQLGVSNPRDTSIAPKGSGVSAKEALEEQNVVKYYDTNAGDNGGYRSARIENIRRITYAGNDYIVQ